MYQNGSLLDEHSSKLKLEKPKTTTSGAALTVKQTTETVEKTTESSNGTIFRKSAKNLTWLWIVLAFSAIGGFIYAVHFLMKYNKNRVKGLSRESTTSFANFCFKLYILSNILVLDD